MRRVFWFSGVLVFWFFGVSDAWGKLEFAGFFENRIEFIGRNDSSPLNPDNRVLDLADVSDQLRLRLSIDTSPYSAAGAHVRIGYFDNLTDARFRHEALVEEAFLNLALPGRVNCIAGKKRLAWGTSFLWNPTDVLSPPKNPQEPEPEENREGVLLLKFERSFGATTVTGTIAPEAMDENSGRFQGVHARLKETQLVGKVDGLVYDTDVTGLVQYGHPVESLLQGREWRFGMSFSRVFSGATEIHGEFIGQRGSMRPPLVPDRDGRDDDSIVLGVILGVHHSFSTNTRLIVEYCHNDEGYSSAEMDQLVDALRTIWRTRSHVGADSAFVRPDIPNPDDDLVDVHQEISARTGNLRKNYVYVRLMQPRLDEVFSLEGNLLWNLDDRSMLLFAEGEYETATNISVSLRTDIPIDVAGEDTSEFGGLGVRSLSLRLGAKVYF